MSEENQGLSLGEQGQPTSAASDEHPAFDPKLADYLRGVIADEVDRRVKSVKDKRFDALEATQREVTNLRDTLVRYGELRAKGMDEDDAIFRMETERRLAQLQSTPAPAQPQSAPGSAPKATSNEITDEVLETLGLSPNDPRVSAIQREGADASRLLKLAVEQKRAAKQAPPPSAVMPAGGGVSSSVTTDSLMAEYQQSISRIRRGDAEPLFKAKLAIRKKAEEAGVPSPV